jgi:hypothetical protein
MIDFTAMSHWDWVAIGTLMLAAATFSLALYNRKIVTTSQAQLETARQDLALSHEQNRTAREALEAQTAPLLTTMPSSLDREPILFHAASGEPQRFRDASAVDVSYGTAGNEPHARISIPFRNVGSGVAVIESIQVMIGGKLFNGLANAPILASGEFTRADIDADRRDSVFDYAASLAVEGSDFSIICGYADSAGNSRGALRLDLHCDRPGSDRWRVRQLHLGDTPEAALNDPTLSSLPL